MVNPRSGRLYRVRLGSGMGLNYSGSVSDKVYYELCERRWCLSPTVRLSFRVKCYARYRDDSITILSTVGQDVNDDLDSYNHSQFLINTRRNWAQVSNIEKWMWGIRKRCAREYVIKVEEVAFDEMRVLDFLVKRVHHRLVFSPYIKECDRPYIRWTSGQPWHVHRSWPLANLRRIQNLCDDSSVFRVARDKVVSRYNMSDILPAALNESRILSMRSHVPTISIGGTTSSPHVKDESAVVWGTLHFHPVLERARIARAFAQVRERWRGHILPIAVRLAWRNSAKPLVNKLQTWLEQGMDGGI